MSSQLTKGLEHRMTYAFKSVEVAALFLLVWTDFNVEVVCPVHVLNERLSTLKNFATLKALFEIVESVPLHL